MGAEADNNEPIPLLPLGIVSSSAEDSLDSDSSDLFALNSSSPHRTGTTWTAVAHIITGVIGSGVLSLSWSMAQLGWIWAPVLMLTFAGITLVSSFLLCDCYRSPDPEYGPARNRSYIEAVNFNLGQTKAWICGLLIQVNLYGTGVAYTITTATCMRQSNTKVKLLPPAWTRCNM